MIHLSISRKHLCLETDRFVRVCQTKQDGDIRIINYLDHDGYSDGHEGLREIGHLKQNKES